MKRLLLLLNALPILLPAQTNYAMVFNGANASVNVGTSIGNTDIRSIEFWFKPKVTINASTTIGGWGLIARNDDSEMYEYGVYIRGNEWTNYIGNLVFTRRDNGICHEVFSNSNSWVAGTWYHVAGVIDPVNGMMLYINGVLQNSSDPSSTAVQHDVNTTNIGVWGNADIRYFNGRMDEMRVWDRAISQAEIQARMCQELVPANETGLVAYWKFDEGNGSQLTDATINGYHGTVSNVAWVPESPCGMHDNAILTCDTDGGQIILFPNPAGAAVTVDMTNEIHMSEYFLYNSLGERVLAGWLYPGDNAVDLSRLDDGMYRMCIKKPGGLIAKTLVVQK